MQIVFCNFRKLKRSITFDWIYPTMPTTFFYDIYWINCILLRDLPTYASPTCCWESYSYLNICFTLLPRPSFGERCTAKNTQEVCWYFAIHYSLYQKNITLWNLNYLQAIVLIWHLWMLRIYDPQKHIVLYTRELYDVIVNFQCVRDLNLFLQIINSKQSELSN